MPKEKPMKLATCHLVVFSPCKGTLKTALAISWGTGLPTSVHDLTLPAAREEARNNKLVFGPEDLVIIAFPVYGGRLPVTAEEIFPLLSGNATPAILAAVYGNRDYEDALIEAQRLAEGRGIIPIAATAALAEHNYTANVAQGRPDSADTAKLEAFGRNVGVYALSLTAPREAAFTAPGEEPYRKPVCRPPFRPDVADSCTRCGECVAVCPAGAIPADAPNTTQEACIVCTACTKVCPVGARTFQHEMFAKSVAWLEGSCATRREPEFFPVALG